MEYYALSDIFVLNTSCYRWNSNLQMKLWEAFDCALNQPTIIAMVAFKIWSKDQRKKITCITIVLVWVKNTGKLKKKLENQYSSIAFGDQKSHWCIGRCKWRNKYIHGSTTTLLERAFLINKQIIYYFEQIFWCCYFVEILYIFP